MENQLQAIKKREAREFTPIEVNGQTLVRSVREINFIRDAIKFGTTRAAKKYGISQRTGWAYLNRDENKMWLQDEITKAAARASVDFGWVIREFKRIVEGKRDADKIIVESLKNMAKMIGAYKNTNLHVNYDVELRFDGEDNGTREGHISDSIETSCEPGEGTQQSSEVCGLNGWQEVRQDAIGGV